MNKKVSADKKGSPVWLIIFLCAVIVGLVWLISYSRRLGATVLLNEEIERLNQKLEEQEQLGKEEIKKLSDFYNSLQATESATVSSKLKSKISTNSGETK